MQLYTNTPPIAHDSSLNIRVIVPLFNRYQYLVVVAFDDWTGEAIGALIHETYSSSQVFWQVFGYYCAATIYNFDHPDLKQHLNLSPQRLKFLVTSTLTSRSGIQQHEVPHIMERKVIHGKPQLFHYMPPVDQPQVDSLFRIVWQGADRIYRAACAKGYHLQPTDLPGDPQEPRLILLNNPKPGLPTIEEDELQASILKAASQLINPQHPTFLI